MYLNVDYERLDPKFMWPLQNDKFINQKFNFASIKYKDLVLLSTEEIDLGNKNDIRKVYKNIEDF